LVDPAQGLRGIDDSDAGMAAEWYDVLAIALDDQVGPRRHRGGDELIVVDIARHDARYGGGRDQLDDLDVIGDHVDGARVLRS